MKSLLLIFTLPILFSCASKATANCSVDEAADSTVYNAGKAADIGADEYGMKKYVIAFLKKGPNTELDSAASADIMRAHMDNINKMAKAGKLAVAGPFMDDSDLRGIYVFNVESIAEAEKLTKTDPAVQAGVLAMELHPWYGSAAVSEISERHKIYAKKSF